MPQLATGHLHTLLGREGFRPAVLKAGTVAPDRREEWIGARVREGADVLICHPRLVQTGLDRLLIQRVHPQDQRKEIAFEDVLDIRGRFARIGGHRRGLMRPASRPCRWRGPTRCKPRQRQLD